MVRQRSYLSLAKMLPGANAFEIIGTPTAARRPLVEFHTFRVRQYDGVFHEPNHTTVSSVTVHSRFNKCTFPVCLLPYNRQDYRMVLMSRSE